MLIVVFLWGRHRTAPDLESLSPSSLTRARRMMGQLEDGNRLTSITRKTGSLTTRNGSPSPNGHLLLLSPHTRMLNTSLITANRTAALPPPPPARNTLLPARPRRSSTLMGQSASRLASRRISTYLWTRTYTPRRTQMSRSIR